MKSGVISQIRRFALILQSAHDIWMLSPGHPFLFWFTMKFGMYIESLLIERLFLLHL